MNRTTNILKKLDMLRFFQGRGPRPAPHITTQQNVYILPTRAGYFFAVTLLLMLLGTINYSNSLGYMFTFLLGSFAIVAILHTYKNLLHLQVRHRPIDAVFAGETARLPVVIHRQNDSSHIALDLGATAKKTNITLDINSSQTITSLPLDTQKRGLYPLPRFVISTKFPVGLFRAWTHVHFNNHYLVYPAPAKSTPSPPVARYRFSLLGEQGHGSDDFIGLRTYHPGDSLKHIHWKAHARQLGLLTKQFGGDRSEELWLDWYSLDGYGQEERLSIISRWILDADKAGHAYGLRLPGSEINPSQGVTHKQQCLEKLALFGSH